MLAKRPFPSTRKEVGLFVEKTARLRSLRVAKEAADLDAEARDNPDIGSAKLL